MNNIAIIGNTTWGTALAIMLAKKENQTRLWTRTEREAEELRNKGLDPERFPGITLPDRLIVTSQIAEAMEDAKEVILAVPSQSMRQNIQLIATHITKSTLLISASKGLELGSGKRMSQVIKDEIDPRFHSNICVLSGPNLAGEIMRNLPAASVAASLEKHVAHKVQRLLTSHNFRVFTNSDVTGVELGGALKNIVALGAGIADGMGYGDNAKAAFMTRGLTEITALGVAMGANPLTFSGLTGLGDVIATCASPLSRNHYVGEQLARGRPLTEILDTMAEVAEGVTTTMVARKIAQQLGLEMPITEKIYQVLYEGADCSQVASALFDGNARHELAGHKWRLFSLFRRDRHSPLRR